MPVAQASNQSRCGVCSSPIKPEEPQVLEHEGRSSHRDCYIRKNGLLCAGCSNLLTGEGCIVLGRRWHSACLQCSSCGGALYRCNERDAASPSAASGGVYRTMVMLYPDFGDVAVAPVATGSEMEFSVKGTALFHTECLPPRDRRLSLSKAAATEHVNRSISPSPKGRSTSPTPARHSLPLGVSLTSVAASNLCASSDDRGATPMTPSLAPVKKRASHLSSISGSHYPPSPQSAFFNTVQQRFGEGSRSVQGTLNMSRYARDRPEREKREKEEAPPTYRRPPAVKRMAEAQQLPTKIQMAGDVWSISQTKRMAVHAQDNTQRARVKLGSVADIEKERTNLTLAQGTGVVELVGFVKLRAATPASNNQALLLTAWKDGGDVYCQAADSQGQGLDENFSRIVFGKLCLALTRMHRKGMAHRDLRLENVILGNPVRGPSFLKGFRLARRFRRHESASDVVGGPAQVSPEAILMLLHEQAAYNPFQADVWAVGVCLYQMLAGRDPKWIHVKPRGFLPDETGFGEVPSERELRKLLRAYQSGPGPLPAAVSPEAVDLLASLLCAAPNERPTAPEILCHPWLASLALNVMPSVGKKLVRLADSASCHLAVLSSAVFCLLAERFSYLSTVAVAAALTISAVRIAEGNLLRYCIILRCDGNPFKPCLTDNSRVRWEKQSKSCLDAVKKQVAASSRLPRNTKAIPPSAPVCSQAPPGKGGKSLKNSPVKQRSPTSRPIASPAPARKPSLRKDVSIAGRIVEGSSVSTEADTPKHIELRSSSSSIPALKDLEGETSPSSCSSSDAGSPSYEHIYSYRQYATVAALTVLVTEIFEQDYWKKSLHLTTEEEMIWSPTNPGTPATPRSVRVPGGGNTGHLSFPPTSARSRSTPATARLSSFANGGGAVPAKAAAVSLRKRKEQEKLLLERLYPSPDKTRNSEGESGASKPSLRSNSLTGGVLTPKQRRGSAAPPPSGEARSHRSGRRQTTNSVLYASGLTFGARPRGENEDVHLEVEVATTASKDSKQSAESKLNIGGTSPGTRNRSRRSSRDDGSVSGGSVSDAFSNASNNPLHNKAGHPATGTGKRSLEHPTSSTSPHDQARRGSPPVSPKPIVKKAGKSPTGNEASPASETKPITPRSITFRSPSRTRPAGKQPHQGSPVQRPSQGTAAGSKHGKGPHSPISLPKNASSGSLAENGVNPFPSADDQLSTKMPGDLGLPPLDQTQSRKTSGGKKSPPRLATRVGRQLPQPLQAARSSSSSTADTAGNQNEQPGETVLEQPVDSGDRRSSIATSQESNNDPPVAVKQHPKNHPPHLTAPVQVGTPLRKTQATRFPSDSPPPAGKDTFPEDAKFSSSVSSPTSKPVTRRSIGSASAPSKPEQPVLQNIQAQRDTPILNPVSQTVSPLHSHHRDRFMSIETTGNEDEPLRDDISSLNGTFTKRRDSLFCELPPAATPASSLRQVPSPVNTAPRAARSSRAGLGFIEIPKLDMELPTVPRRDRDLIDPSGSGTSRSLSYSTSIAGLTGFPGMGASGSAGRRTSALSPTMTAKGNTRRSRSGGAATDIYLAHQTIFRESRPSPVGSGKNSTYSSPILSHSSHPSAREPNIASPRRFMPGSPKSLHKGPVGGPVLGGGVGGATAALYKALFPAE